VLRLEVQQIDNENLRINLYSVDSISPPLKEFRSVKIYQLEALADELLLQIPQAYLTRGRSVDLLEKLKLKGQALFQTIFGETGVQLRRLADLEEPEHLVISVDEAIAHLPFDILYTGDIFLWQGFIISRQIATEKGISHTNPRVIKGRKLALVGDPSADPALDTTIREELFTLGEDLETVFDLQGPLMGSSVTRQTLEEVLTDCSMLHFSGHFETDETGKSGWLLDEGEIFAGDALSHFRQLPHFVFSNTCGSSGTLRSNAFIHNFLEAGICAFLTTNGDIPSVQATWFGIFFYRSLLKGYSYGRAVHRARSSLIDRFGISDLSWMFYILYGDAEARPLLKGKRRVFRNKKLLRFAIPLLITGLLGLVSLLLYRRFQSGEFFLNTDPVGAVILLNDEPIGLTPRTVRAGQGDIIQLIHSGWDTSRFQVRKPEKDWFLQPLNDVDGLITERKIMELPEVYGHNPRITMIPAEMNLLKFDLRGLPEPELMIQGCPLKFYGGEILLAVDTNLYRYILRSGDKVYDNALAVNRDSTLTASGIIENWSEGRYH